jgi:hypothetical protein
MTTECQDSEATSTLESIYGKYVYSILEYTILL